MTLSKGFPGTILIPWSLWIVITLQKRKWINWNEFFWSTLVRHFVTSAKVLSLNSTITQAGNLYGSYLGPPLCSKNISLTIPINQLMSLYSLSSLINNMTLHPTFNAVSFGKLDSFKQWFAPFDVINVEYWGIIFATGVRNIFRYLIVGSILCFHCVTRWIALLNVFLFFLLTFERKRLIKSLHFHLLIWKVLIRWWFYDHFQLLVCEMFIFQWFYNHLECGLKVFNTNSWSFDTMLLNGRVGTKCRFVRTFGCLLEFSTQLDFHMVLQHIWKCLSTHFKLRVNILINI